MHLKRFCGYWVTVPVRCHQGMGADWKPEPRHASVSSPRNLSVDPPKQTWHLRGIRCCDGWRRFYGRNVLTWLERLWIHEMQGLLTCKEHSDSFFCFAQRLLSELFYDDATPEMPHEWWASFEVFTSQQWLGLAFSFMFYTHTIVAGRTL